MIESIGGDGHTYRLLDENFNPVQLGSYFSSNGTSYKIEGGRPPQHEGSSGRVWARADGQSQREFYPGVFDMKWVRV